jgi:CitMHS family citrate-Mg2+:H+ or citrate-Ca2+:H+ symporter
VLVTLGFLMIAVFMYLIMSRRTTPVVALILVPVAFGIAAGAGTDIGDMVMTSVEDLAPTAALLFFAITYFGIMIDVGLFDPLIRKILRLVGHDPVKLVLGTAALTAVVSLDGDGSTTFIIVTSALLPVYLRLGMSPVVLTCVAAVTNGVLNVVPWGGPTARAAAALNVSPTDIFVPMIPSMIAGILAVLVLAWMLGRSERKRVGLVHLPADREAGTDGTGGGADPAPAGIRDSARARAAAHRCVGRRAGPSEPSGGVRRRHASATQSVPDSRTTPRRACPTGVRRPGRVWSGSTWG